MCDLHPRHAMYPSTCPRAPQRGKLHPDRMVHPLPTVRVHRRAAKWAACLRVGPTLLRDRRYGAVPLHKHLFWVVLVFVCLLFGLHKIGWVVGSFGNYLSTRTLGGPCASAYPTLPTRKHSLWSCVAWLAKSNNDSRNVVASYICFVVSTYHHRSFLRFGSPAWI